MEKDGRRADSRHGQSSPEPAVQGRPLARLAEVRDDLRRR